MLITKVQKDSGKDKTYSIFVDNEFDFKVSQQDIHKLAIYEGREFTKDELAWTKHQASFAHAKNIAIGAIAYKIRTVHEIKSKLNEAGVNYEIIEEVIEYLTENGYLNDELYVQKFIQEKNRLSSLSDKAIIYKLREKGIPHEIIDSALKENARSEVEAARKLAQKRLKGAYNQEKKLELKEYLYKKGFSGETINQLIREIEDNSEENA